MASQLTLEAIYGLYDPLSTHEIRSAADGYLQKLRSSPAAWDVGVHLLSQLLPPNAADAPMRTVVRMIASQLLRVRAQRSTLPPDITTMVVAALTSARAADTESTVRTQLCLAAAALAIRSAAWSTAEVMQNLLALGGAPDVVLELLSILPEELTEKTLSMDPRRREALRVGLVSQAVAVAGLLAQIVAAAAADTLTLTRSWVAWVSSLFF
jgi:hypothetical protein